MSTCDSARRLWCELRIFPLDGAGAGIHNFRQQPLLSPHGKLRLLYTKMIGNTEYLGDAELGGTVIPRNGLQGGPRAGLLATEVTSSRSCITNA